MRVFSKFLAAAGFFGLLALSAAPTQAQTATNPVVVATCGTANYATAIGQPRAQTMDVNGNICGATTGGGGGAVTVADGADITQGAKADAAATDNTGSWTIRSMLGGIWGKLNTLANATSTSVTQLAATPVSVLLQNAAVANGNGATLNVNGMASAVLTVNCATCSGGTTVNFEGTEDGTNYFPLSATQLGTTTIATSTTTAGLTAWQLPVAGLQFVRARISAYSAGTVTITGHTVPVDWNSRVNNALAFCQVVTSTPTYSNGIPQLCTLGARGGVPIAVDGVNITNLTGSPEALFDRGGSSRVIAVGPFGYNGTSQDVMRTSQGAVSSAGVGIAAVEEVGRPFAHISTSTTTTVKSGAGFLHTVTVNNLGTVASTCTIYDNTAGSGTVIAVLNTLAGQETYTYDVAFATGLTVVTTGTVAPDITVSYR